MYEYDTLYPLINRYLSNLVFEIMFSNEKSDCNIKHCFMNDLNCTRQLYTYPGREFKRKSQNIKS